MAPLVIRMSGMCSTLYVIDYGFIQHLTMTGMPLDNTTFANSMRCWFECMLFQCASFYV